MWVIVILLILAMVVLQYRFASLNTLVKFVFSHRSRDYSVSENDAVSLMTGTILRVAEIALLVMLLRYPQHEFTWLAFGRIVLITLGVILVRNIGFKWVMWTFLPRQLTEEFRAQYAFMNRGMSCMLLPVIVVMLHFTYPPIMLGAVGVLLLSWCVTIMIKWVQVLGWRTPMLLYAVLYLGCLQLIPLGCIWVLSDKWV